jgi:transposase-like protein
VLRHPGDLQWLERRRLLAADLFARGKTRAEVAGELGVSAQTASRWYGRWRHGGVAGMRTARQGKPAQLGPAQLARVRRMSARGSVIPAGRSRCHRLASSGSTALGRTRHGARPIQPSRPTCDTSEPCSRNDEHGSACRLVLQPHFSESLPLSPVATTSTGLVTPPPA